MVRQIKKRFANHPDFGGGVSILSSLLFTYATLDGIVITAGTVDTNKLVYTHTTTGVGTARSSAQKNSGKWYFEVTCTTGPAATNNCCGVMKAGATDSNVVSSGLHGGICFQGGGGIVFANDTSSGLGVGTDIGVGEVIGVAVDLDNDKIWFRKSVGGPSNLWYNLSSGTQNPVGNVGGASISNYSGTTVAPFCGFTSGTAGAVWTLNCGQSPFSLAAPTGFLPWTNTVPGPEAEAFLGRTSGLDSGHINAYADLINGLVADSVWTKFDWLHIYATQTSSAALLNLVSSNYNGTSHGSPTFTADQGFTGVGASGTVFIDSGFDPFLAVSPNYVRNSAHVSAWSLQSAAAGGSTAGCIMGAQGSGVQTNIFPRYQDGNAYFRVNGSGISGVANSDGKGHYVANRSSSTVVDGYKNGSSILPTASDTSLGVADSLEYVLAQNDNGNAATGFAGQTAMASCGSSLSSTDTTNFYNRLRTYMTAVGIP